MQTMKQIRDQIDALEHTYIFYTGKEIRYLPQILADGERILALTSGYVAGKTWLCVCTTRRVIFLHRGMLFGLRQVQMNLDRIQSIDTSFTIFFGRIRLWDGATSVEVGMVLKSTVVPFARTVQAAMDNYKRMMVHDLANAATSAHRTAEDAESIGEKGLTPAANPMVAELERLSKLKADGHLTDAEFTAAKARLLGGE